MYNTLAKHGTSIAFGLGALIVAIFLATVFGQIGDMTTVDELKQTNIFDLGLYLTIALAVLCAIAILGFGVYQIVTDFKGAMKGLIGIGVLILIFFGAYASASPEVLGDPIFDTIQKFNISEGVSKFVSGAIVTTGVTLAIAVVALIGSAVSNFIK